MKITGSIRLILLLLLLIVLSVLVYLCLVHELYFSSAFIGLFIVIVILYIVRLQNNSYRMIRRMIEGIRFSDFTFSYFPEKGERQMSELAGVMNESITMFREKFCETEVKYQYYETLLDTVDTGILVSDADGNIEWMNRAALSYINKSSLRHIDELGSLNPEFPEMLESLKNGEVKVLRIVSEDMVAFWAVTVTCYISKRKELRLINLKNIRSVLEQNEIESWQKLIRVLTHEIMNSIAPIISLSETLSERADAKKADEQNYTVMLQAMQVIHRRSKGLSNFVENYRKLTRISAPVLAPVRIGDVLEDLKKLFTDSSVAFHYHINDPDICLFVDRIQIEQVLINLIKNAIEACKTCSDGCVSIVTGKKDPNGYYISVSDNGAGILPDVLDKIFIPFFTTKVSGSGIGLSLCKQIMNLHGGDISVSSTAGKGSCFSLRFVDIKE